MPHTQHCLFNLDAIQINFEHRQGAVPFNDATHGELQGGQVIDDAAQSTLCSASTVDKELRSDLKANAGSCDASVAVGALVAKRAIAKGIQQVVFDRGGNLYHGRVKALADAAREAGLQF